MKGGIRFMESKELQILKEVEVFEENNNVTGSQQCGSGGCGGGAACGGNCGSGSGSGCGGH